MGRMIHATWWGVIALAAVCAILITAGFVLLAFAASVYVVAEGMRWAGMQIGSCGGWGR